MPTELNVEKITIEALTEGTINGKGIFDKLMSTVNAHLLEQFARGRIDTTQYSEVYLGSIQTTISQSIQFLLTKDQSFLQSELIKAQVEKTRAEVLLAEAQAAIAQKELLVMDSKIAQAEKQVLLLNAELERQPLLKEQLTTENAILDVQKDKVAQEVLNLAITKEKLQSEVALLTQKKVTEVAQTQDGAAGVVGAQIDLYAAQRQGFIDDAKVKRVKAANDVYAIAKSNDPDAVQDPSNMISTLQSALTQLLN